MPDRLAQVARIETALVDTVIDVVVLQLRLQIGAQVVNFTARHRCTGLRQARCRLIVHRADGLFTCRFLELLAAAYLCFRHERGASHLSGSWPLFDMT